MIGGDPSIFELRVQTIADSYQASLFPKSGTRQHSISFATAVVLLFKASCATDAFNIAETFASGILIPLIACVFMLFFTQASFYIFTRTWTFGHAYNYEDVWTFTFGPKFNWIPKTGLVLAYLSCLVSGYWEITVYIPDLLLSIWPDAPELFLNKWFLVYVSAFLLSIPCLCVSRMGSFGWASWLSFLSYFVALACLIVHFFRIQWDDGFVSASRVVLLDWNFDYLYQAVSDYNVAFFAHSFVAEIAQEMNRPSRQRCMAMTWGAFSIVAVANYAVPFVGYLLFSGVLYQDNVLARLSPKDPEIRIAKIAVIVISLVSTVFFEYHISRAVAGMIVPQAGQSGGARLLSCLGLTFPSICIVIIGDAACDRSYEIAALAFTLLGFVLPPVYYLVQFRFRFVKWGLISVSVLVIGVVFLIFSLVQTVMWHWE
jgi:hypothetical protein